MIAVVNKKTHAPTPDDLYCGRGSALGNIYDFRNSTHPQVKHHCATKEECIVNYEKYLKQKIAEKDPEICKALNLIYKKAKTGRVNLVCYCFPEPCHAEIIKKIIEEKLDILPKIH